MASCCYGLLLLLQRQQQRCSLMGWDYVFEMR
jgi:hypothetical protein